MEPVLKHILLLSILFWICQLVVAQSGCRSCYAYGKTERPLTRFKHVDGCYEYECDCFCNGSWACPSERTKDICRGSNPECRTCSAGGNIRAGGKPFSYTEGCYEYHCMCRCDGGWNCPADRTIDVCNTNRTTGCYYCDVHGRRVEGNSHFTHRNGCIEYSCTCRCDGGWNCPGELAVDHCNQNPQTGCYYCDVDGMRHEGNSRFQLTRDCWRWDCICSCDGGWDCSQSRGVWVCGQDNRNCRDCVVEGTTYRTGRSFQLTKGCTRYSCDCNCRGDWYCPADRSRNICTGRDRLGTWERRAIGSGILYSSSIVSDTMSTTGSGTSSTGSGSSGSQGRCEPCNYEGRLYNQGDAVTKIIGCNKFRCRCTCEGRVRCPPTPIEILEDCGSGGRGSGGISGTSVGSGSTFRGTITSYNVDSTSRGVFTDTCLQCTYGGNTYEPNSQFEFTKSACWRFTCNCACNGDVSCTSQWICETQRQCLRCRVFDQIHEPETEFQLTRPCTLYSTCRCNCDGSWDCEDGEYTCPRCDGCNIDGQNFDGDATFTLRRGCDVYNDCYCSCDGGWNCEPEGHEDVCGACRMCNVSGQWHNGNSQFQSQIGCTNFRECECDCDGTWNCANSVYTCPRGNQDPPCTRCQAEGRRYGRGQRITYQDGCVQYRDCECLCNGDWFCREVADSCGSCRECVVDGVTYPGNSKFARKSGCLLYRDCDCNCDSTWNCPGENAVDTCNLCQQCNAYGNRYEPFTSFQLENECYKYFCFCSCNGTTNCPSDTAINTCDGPANCRQCEFNGQRITGNSQFKTQYQGVGMSCRCNCDGSLFCYGEMVYFRTDVTETGLGIGPTEGGCYKCLIDGRSYLGGTQFTIQKAGIDLVCNCYCNGGYYCLGEKTFGDEGCRSCSVYGNRYDGGSSFSFVYAGFKLNCQCDCNGGYICLGRQSEVVITCDGVSGCLTGPCDRCVVDGTAINGFSVFSTSYKGIPLTCTCGCDGSYYCEGQSGLIISCVGGICTEISGCLPCSAFGFTYPGGESFPLIYQGLQINCNCQCGGDYLCYGSTGSVVISCLGGQGCLASTCTPCLVDGRRHDGRSTFRTIYNGIDMNCQCGCDGSYFCTGVNELIKISCVGGICTQVGCGHCNIFGQRFPGDESFKIVYTGLVLNCQCSCNGDYICLGSNSETIIRCVSGVGCLSGTCRQCVLGGGTYRGLSTFKYVYEGIDMNCQCGCDGSVYCEGVTELIEISCIGGRCTQIGGCRTCSIFGQNYAGGSSFELVYNGIRINCDCSCTGGYRCEGRGGAIFECLNGVGSGCFPALCRSCNLDGREYTGRATFPYVYNGISMTCTCGCDGTSHCVGVTELIEISCIGGSCTPIGCQSCDIFGRTFPGGSNFEIIYEGIPLQCSCNCQGGYRCVGSSGRVVVECPFRGNCLPPPCRSCNLDNREYPGRSTFPYTYNGIAMSCRCGCDGTSYCEGVTEIIEISCIGGVCSPRGCQSCSLFGRTYAGATEFDLIYQGILVRCSCNCQGGYRCVGSTGSTVIECQRGGNCLPPPCRSCNVDGRIIPGLSTFNYVYNGIDMRCTCGCDTGYYCKGVSQIIEIGCFGDRCSPINCGTCSIYGNVFPGASQFNFVHRGVLMDCSCSCDGSYRCISTITNEVVDICPDERICRAGDCQRCEWEGTEYGGNTEFVIIYGGRRMNCRSGCDRSFYCVGDDGVKISCIDGQCNQIGCSMCLANSRRYSANAEFDFLYDGTRMSCLCNCDGSYRCQGYDVSITVVCRDGRCDRIGCQTCRVGGQEYQHGDIYERRRGGGRERCRCECNGRSTCQPYVQPSCQNCIIDGQSYEGHTRFRHYRNEVPYICTCWCNGTHGCVPERARPSCQYCVIDGVRHDGGTEFQIDTAQIRYRCTCRCDGTYECRGKSIGFECQGRGCSESCRRCSIEGQSYDGNTRFQALVRGTRMECSCDCAGSWRCVSESMTCTDRGCSNNQREGCRVDGVLYAVNQRFETVRGGETMECICSSNGEARCQSVCRGPQCGTCPGCVIGDATYPGNTEFEAMVSGRRMRCTCKCGGSYTCRSRSTEPCTDATCDSSCRPCVINGVHYRGNSRFEAMINNIRMQCTCKCGGSYTCRGEIGGGSTGTCINCEVDGRAYSGNSNFQIQRDGVTLDCTCKCDGSYKCHGEKTTTVCEGPGCDTGCRRCSVNGREYAGNSRFDTVIDGVNVNCECRCDGGYTCKGTKEIPCTGPGCRGGCLSCNAYGRRIPGNSEFETIQDGIRLRCTCRCDGSYSCQGRTEIPPTHRGCRMCLIDGRQYTGNTRFEISKGSLVMQCACYCNGSYTCQGSTVETSCLGGGCADEACLPCYLDGQRYEGRTSFQLDKAGIRMDCTCECDGAYRCNSIGATCEGPDCGVSGCKNCEIDGQLYPGGTTFKIRKGNNIELDCECDCDGSYNCDGQALAVTCRGSNCGSGGCNSCFIDRQTYQGNTRFAINKYGLRMQCVCNCDGSYRCRAYQVTEICRGPNCPRGPASGCQTCEAFGTTHQPNTAFEQTVNGVRSRCVCKCDGSYSCTPLTAPECVPCVINNERYPANREFRLNYNGESIPCRCSCNGDFVCEGGVVPCRGAGCQVGGCQDCTILGVRYQGNTEFTTDASSLRMQCRCNCDGSYSCTRYKHTTVINLQPAEAGLTHGGAGSSAGSGGQTGSSGRSVISSGQTFSSRRTSSRTSSSGTQSSTRIISSSSSERQSSSRVRSSSSETQGTSRVGTSISQRRGNCRTCSRNNISYEPNTKFEFTDKCIRYSCTCNCNGGYECPAGDAVKVCDLRQTTSSGSHRTVVTVRPRGSRTESRSEIIRTSSTGNSSSTGSRAGGSYSVGTRRISSGGRIESFSGSTSSSGGTYSSTSRSGASTSGSSAGGSATATYACRVGTRLFNTRKFTYDQDCKRYSCRCYKNGSFNCPDNKTVKIC